MTHKVILEQICTDGLQKIASMLRGQAECGNRGMTPADALVTADMLRQAVRFLISVADGLDPNGVSVVLVDVSAAVRQAAVGGILAASQQQAQEIERLRTAAPAVVGERVMLAGDAAEKQSFPICEDVDK